VRADAAGDEILFGQAAGGHPPRARSRSPSSQTWWKRCMRPGIRNLLARASQPCCVSSVRTWQPSDVFHSSQA
jgi:hypothetical protein